MKNLTFLIILILSITACSNSKHVTFKPDPQTTTSGTLGTEKAEINVPRRTTDSTRDEKIINRTKDSSKYRRQ